MFPDFHYPYEEDPMHYDPDKHRAASSFEEAVRRQQAHELAAQTRHSGLSENVSEDEWLTMSPVDLERWAATGRLVA